MRLSKRHVVVWSAVALVLIVIGTVAIVVGSRLGAQNRARAIFTIHEALPGSDGAITLKYDIEVIGSLSAGLAHKTGTRVSTVTYFHHLNFGIGQIFGFRSGSTNTWNGRENSFRLGDCPASQRIKTPLTIELKPDEQFVLATCRDATGATVELFVYCDY
jgi:hypothetical protein